MQCLVNKEHNNLINRAIPNDSIEYLKVKLDTKPRTYHKEKHLILAFEYS